MTALDKTPLNINFLNPLNFQFQIKRAPNLNFFIQKVNIPELALATIPKPTLFMPLPSPGKIVYSPFQITFKMDEDLQSYLEIFLWMEHLGFPETFQQYAEIAAQDLTTGNGVISDISLLIHNSVNQPNYIFTMTDAFPVALSTDNVLTDDNTVNYMTATASFNYRTLKIEHYDS